MKLCPRLTGLMRAAAAALPLLILCSHASVSRACPPPLDEDDHSVWLARGEHCYMMGVSTEVTWFQAEADCVSRGGHLASVHSSEEMDFISDRVIAQSPAWGHWIGLNDRFHECATDGSCPGWRYTDGSPVDFTYWDEGEPDVRGRVDEDCVFLLAGGGDRWHDLPCAGRYLIGYVCKARNRNTEQHS